MKNRSLSALSFLFIAIGVLLTLENFNIVRGISRNWPVLVLILGLGFWMLFFRRQRNDAALLWIGSFLVSLGVFFYYLTFTAWSRLARQWPVFLGIVGLSFLIVSIFLRHRIFIYFSIFFIALFFALYLVFSVALNLWPLSLIIFGLSLLGINLFLKKPGG